jgi:hypothetical protein
MQGLESGFDAGTATDPAGMGGYFAEHPGLFMQADGGSNGMSLDYVYAQIQQQQQMQLEQQLHSAMTTCADTCTADYQAFAVGVQQGPEASCSASPVAMPANMQMFGRLDSVCSVTGGRADDAMQAHVENVMMAELMAELSKAQQEQQQQQQQSSLLQQSLLLLQQQQQQMQHAGFASLVAADPCDAGSSKLPTLPALAQPTLQQPLHLQTLQQQTLLAPSYLPQHGCRAICHSSCCSCMPAGYTPAAVPAAGTMGAARPAGDMSCFGIAGSTAAAALPAAHSTGLHARANSIVVSA